MRIAFILSNGVFSHSSGVVSQARTWKAGLESLGNEVVLVDMWQKNEWESFDGIHFFGFSIYMRDLILVISRVNKNIVVSPILDPDYSVNRFKLYAHWGSFKLGLTNHYHELYRIRANIRLFCVRSEFEKEYIVKGFGVDDGNCAVLPIAYDYKNASENCEKREAFCLHIGFLVDERKNVQRLIQAAVKYKFRLVLGGRLRNKEETQLIKKWIEGSSNVEYRGYLSEDEMASLYSRAKVFALPSLNEGVGIVALDAAAMGCDIVITNIGGPKEYYGGMAKIVDPYSVDDIGNAVVQFLNDETFQPKLGEFIRSNYSPQVIAKRLVRAYEGMV